MATKAEVQRARNSYWLREAQNQLGNHIKSLSQVKVISPARKPRFSLGETLVRKSKRK